MVCCDVKLSQMMQMLPGFGAAGMPQGNDKASQLAIKRFITIIESECVAWFVRECMKRVDNKHTG
jgi:hypothetical protein